MELPRRRGADVYLPDGTFGQRVEALRPFAAAADAAIGIFYAFDARTRMLPFWYADRRMAPCAVRLLGDVLSSVGFRNVRIVLQQWTPNVRPSRARLNGRPLDILMVSSMQVHAERAAALIRDAHALGGARPLILAGGPKAIYEPTDFFDLGPTPGIGADCVVTGEAFVLLDLLLTVFQHSRPGETPREAFERAREGRVLADVPGLVYLSPDAAQDRPVAINTGVQRLVRDLDELPMPDAGYRMLEPPHRRRDLSPLPCPAHRVGKISTLASVISTQGCKFNCSYCPIPAVNQRTWRHKSPRRLAAEIVHIHENFGIKGFFSTDDNFFNDRQTVIDLMTELARTRIGGKPLAGQIRFYTEATQFDVYKNRDLLPLARAGGLAAIWFGIEDITAELVNKGQTAGKTAELFRLLHSLGIEPMTMMIHSDRQPLRSPRGDLSGLLNEARYLFEQGAVSYQCTYLGPAVGTRDFEPAAKAGAIYNRVGGRPAPQAFQDGNHVVAWLNSRPWERQLNVLRAYAAFYNPRNLWRTLLEARRGLLGWKRVAFQLIGQIGLLITTPKLAAWALRLKRGPIEVYPGLQPARITMVDAAGGVELDWAIQQASSIQPQHADAIARAARRVVPRPMHGHDATTYHPKHGSVLIHDTTQVVIAVGRRVRPRQHQGDTLVKDAVKPRSDMRSKSILLVEDDCHEIDRAMAALSDNGTDCAMIVCRNGEEAIDYLRQRDDPTPSLILLGLRPCNLDRRKLLLDIKHDPEFHTIPVVVFTAWCETSDVIACYQLDANAYVVRPVNFSDYAQTLSDVAGFWARINMDPFRASTAN